MKKSGKVLISSVVTVVIILVVALFVGAQNSNDSFEISGDEVSPEVEQVFEEVAETGVSDNVKKYVEDFVEQKGIATNDITNISEVNFDDLPKEVNIENVDDSNLDIFEVEYNEENGGEKQVFVISYSVEELREQGDLIIAHDKRQFLHFGLSGESNKSVFLKSASGIETSIEKGYVMVREGSITAISTNLDMLESGMVEIIVYKNGKKIKFGNTIEADVGIAKDHDVQSKGVVRFEPGDVISAYAEVNGKINDVITMVEITTVN